MSPRRRGPKKKKGPSSTAPRLPYNAFATESGVEIRVGRRASDNDLLSCDSRYRDGPDWWLHAAGCPGSHVVIRSHDDNLPSNDADAVRDAACLAARGDRRRILSLNSRLGKADAERLLFPALAAEGKRHALLAELRETDRMED